MTKVTEQIQQRPVRPDGPQCGPTTDDGVGGLFVKLENSERIVRNKRGRVPAVEWLNYHHLFYFWTVAREGSIARASATLRLAQPTISAQIATLERTLGEKLFTRTGRGLKLTDTGQMTLRYADQIFTLGRDLLATIRTQPSVRPLTLNVGITETMPKLIAYRLLQPALRLANPVRLVCREDRPERLLAELATQALDVVLSDAQAGPAIKIRVFHHPLGECGASFFAAPRVAAAYRRHFPRSLDGAPFLLPRDGSPIRAALERWFRDSGLRPRIVGEFDDSALLKVFGQSGVGIFAAPSVIEAQVRRQYCVRVIGRAQELRERFYAIASDRTLRHPAVVAICEAARGRLFSGLGRSAAATKRMTGISSGTTIDPRFTAAGQRHDP
jgi:LysR family transcriptional activator of nhaA